MSLTLGAFKLGFNRLAYLKFYLGTMHFVVLVNMFMAGHQLNTLIVAVVAIYSVVITLSFVVRRLNDPTIGLSYLDMCVLLFLSFSVMSVVLYLQPSNPASISGYLYGVNLLIVPIFLYFTVKELHAYDQERLLRFIFFLHVGLVLVGFVMFFWRPDFYTEYLRENLASRNAYEMWQIYSRLQSYLGSTAVGILAAITIVMLTLVRLRPFTRYLLLLLLLLAVLLTQQRGAYLSAIIATVFFFSYNKISIKYLLFVLTLVFVAVLFVVESSNEDVVYLVDYTANRITGDLVEGDPYSERAVTYRKGWGFLSDFPFGMGIGATLSATDSAGAHPGGQVVDANFMRILADLGLMGFILFMTVLAFGVRAVFVRRKSMGFIVILFIYCFQATGTNVFDSYYVGHLFWLFLGISDTASKG